MIKGGRKCEKETEDLFWMCFYAASWIFVFEIG